jgi:hypothetical protein
MRHGQSWNLMACARKTLILAVLGLALGAQTASAGTFTDSATSCTGQALTRPFLPWLDLAKYMFAPNGGLEQSGSWQLAGGARVVRGNETFSVHGATDAYSLALPAGSSAVTRPMCVGLGDPTLRLFARNGGSLLSTLRVDVLFEGPLGGVQSLPVGLVVAGSRWQPTLPIAFLTNITGSVLSRDGTTAVAFRFTPMGIGGAWQIDDVYVDPFKAR